MTTVTIKNNSVSEELEFRTEIEAAEELLFRAGYILLTEVNNDKIVKKVEKHRKENHERDLSTFDNI